MWTREWHNEEATRCWNVCCINLHNDYRRFTIERRVHFVVLGPPRLDELSKILTFIRQLAPSLSETLLRSWPFVHMKRMNLYHRLDALCHRAWMECLPVFEKSVERISQTCQTRSYSVNHLSRAKIGTGDFRFGTLHASKMHSPSMNFGGSVVCDFGSISITVSACSCRLPLMWAVVW